METWADIACVKDGIATLKCFEAIAKIILNIAIRLAGIAAFIMLIVGGFQFLTAGGDPKKTQAASSTLTYAIFGLVAVIAAWFILLFIEKFTGVRITDFDIPKI
jgi:drug/metabolite transporter (DMT)-like permease